VNTPDETADLSPPATLQVGEWRVVPELNQIGRAGESVRLEPKAIELLVYLAQRGGEVIGREQLLAALWPGVIVGDNALTQVVTKLRKALGDTAREPAYIEAIPKRGYRLIAAVRQLERPQRPQRPELAQRATAPADVPDAAPAPLTPPTPQAPQAPPRRWMTSGALAGLAALGVALALAVAAWWTQRAGDDAGAPDVARSSSSPSAARLPTVVVRPIEAIGEDAEKLMARGLTADLVNDLSKVVGLEVVSAGTPGAPPRPGATVAAGPAGRRYDLGGTLQSDGRTLRLHIQLAESDSGRPLWSQRFERELRDLFAVQDELVRRILEQLPIKVSQAELSALARRYTRNVTAYEHFQRGQAAVQARRRAQNLLAREWYWKAVELDPAFARAYAGLAMTHALAYQLGWEDEAALGRALEFARTAEQMSPDMPEAHWVLGFVETQRRRHAEAARHLQRALRLNPSYADAYALLGGIKTYTGQPADSVPLLRTALRLNPDAGSLYFLLLGRALYFVGDHEQARVNLEQALARNAENVEARIYLAATLHALGDRAGAGWQADEIRVIEPAFSAGRWLATYPMTDRRQQERLEQALRQFGL